LFNVTLPGIGAVTYCNKQNGKKATKCCPSNFLVSFYGPVGISLTLSAGGQLVFTGKQNYLK